MNKQYLVTFLLAAVATYALFSHHTAQQPYSFEQFKADYQKTYHKSGEEEYRKTIFLRNLVRIAEHNAQADKTYEMGVTQFADLTDAEFQAIYLTLAPPKKNIVSVDAKMTPIVGAVDWTDGAKGVTPIKNQGACGSCWAFSAIGALESAYKIQNADSKFFSEQELVDCSTAYGNFGCQGGWMDSGFDYIIDYGIAEDKNYRYTAKDQVCQKGTERGLKTITGYTDLSGGCDNVANALSARPISVAVDASNWSLYRGGVFTNCAKNVNHGVLLVAVSDTFWKIKNSWGAGWGETGYMRLVLGNTCAICDYASYPVL